MLIVRNAYTCQWAYCCHLVGSVVYFLALSTVLLSMAEAFGANRNKMEKILGGVNVVFVAMVTAAVVLCATAESLHDFFYNDPYFRVFSITGEWL